MGLAVAGALTLMGLLVIHIVAGAESRAAPEVLLCNNEEFSETTASLAHEVAATLRVLKDTDSAIFLPDIDRNVYSPTVADAVAFGKRECWNKTHFLGVAECKTCFSDAYTSLAEHCWNNNRVGGQVAYVGCSMRYEIYNFLSS